MNILFSKNILKLRHEKGLSQKQVAIDLDISQSLLSHYEKGIRECGLDFVVKIADYYNVSCDFLLGSSFLPKQDKNSQRNADEKSIVSSINIVYGMLKKISNDNLSQECTNYLSSAVYTIIRYINNENNYYSIDSELFSAVASSKMTMSKAKIKQCIMIENLQGNLPKITVKENTDRYKNLLKLINTAEN